MPEIDMTVIYGLGINEMQKTYREWVAFFERQHGVRTLSGDGLRALHRDGLSENEALDVRTAMNYWTLSTVITQEA